MSILDGVKAYLRVDGNQEDEVIRTLIDTAKTFILQGTGVEVKETDAPVRTLHAYDRRVLVRKQKRSRTRGRITVHNYCTTTAIRNERRMTC